jgi:hypothetical protein
MSAAKKKPPTKQMLARALTKFVRAHLAHEDAEAEVSNAEALHEEAAAKFDKAKTSVCNAVARYEDEHGAQESSRYVVTVDGQRWSVAVGSGEAYIDTIIDLGGK